MKIVMIHGQNHKGSTHMVARLLAEKVGGETKEGLKWSKGTWALKQVVLG